MRRPHDIGGLDAGPIDTEEHPTEPWEKRVRVIREILGRRNPPLISIDELRRGIEDLGAEDYTRLSYHECWTAAIANILLQKGVISVEELGQKMHEVEARWQEDRAS
jgi:hypothetical protein